VTPATANWTAIRMFGTFEEALSWIRQTAKTR